MINFSSGNALSRRVAPLLIFGVGCLTGYLGWAQAAKRIAVNHVAIRVADVKAASDFYAKAFGFKEVFAHRNDNGQVAFVYLQASRDTFVELLPATDQRPAGLDHFGLEIGDARASLQHVKSLGAKAEGPRMGRTNAEIVDMVGPNGERIELLELGPDSMHRKAIEAWD